MVTRQGATLPPSQKVCTYQDIYIDSFRRQQRNPRPFSRNPSPEGRI